jgi:hypothetical protein
MKIFIIHLAAAFAVAATSFANDPKVEVRDVTNAVQATVERFFSEVVIARNLTKANNYFVPLSSAERFPKSFGVNEYSIARNYRFRICEYISSLMNMLPREAEGNRFVSIATMTRIPCSDLEVGYYVRVKCVFSSSGDKFEFITPLVVDVDGAPQFASRFYQLLAYGSSGSEISE